MAQDTTIDALELDLDEARQLVHEAAGQDVAERGFGAEFRELAQQRRFVRESRSSTDAAAATAALRRRSWRDAAATSEPAVVASPPVAAAPAVPQVDLSELVQELARVNGALVQSREQLATATARAAAAEASLRAANDRLMASHVLVREAQAATHASAERVRQLEGRCETLQAALELAVNASFVTRWRWRREQRRAALAAPSVD